MLSEDCVFCQNVIKKRDAFVIYENENVLTFMDKFPVEPGHVLVIPKSHYENILDIDYDLYLEVHRVSKLLCLPVIRALHADAINVGQNNGTCANQKVFHYHVHLIPRFCGREIGWRARNSASDDELDEIAERIKAEIGNSDKTIPKLK